MREPHLFVPWPLQSPVLPSFCAQDKATTSKARFVLTIELLPHCVTLHSAQGPKGSGSSTLPGEGNRVPAAKEKRGWVAVTLRGQGGLPEEGP